MQARVTLLMLLCISGCALLPKTDAELEQEMATKLANNELRAAYDTYGKLSNNGKQTEAVIQYHQQLKQKISAIRTATEQQANQAIRNSDWKNASNLYHKQLALIVTDPTFQKSYQDFQKKLEHQKAPLKNSFLVVKANYLIEKRKMERLIQKLDPYDNDNENQLEITKQEARSVSKKLLAQGLEAVKNNDIAKARTLIPLAKRLVNNKTARKATQTLEKLTKPMEEYIEKLTEYGTKLYSNEEYNGALEIWDEVLYLDPNNEKVKANKERTEKVLQTLEKIKKENIVRETNGQ